MDFLLCFYLEKKYAYTKSALKGLNPTVYGQMIHFSSQLCYLLSMLCL